MITFVPEAWLAPKASRGARCARKPYEALIAKTLTLISLMVTDFAIIAADLPTLCLRFTGVTLQAARRIFNVLVLPDLTG